MRKPFLFLFLFLIIFESIVYFTQPYFTVTHKSYWKIIHLFEMLSLIVIMLIQKKEIYNSKNDLSTTLFNLITTGLLFSIIGDLINSYLIDLTCIIKTQSILSALPFSIAHILYIRSNYIISEKYATLNRHVFYPMQKLRKITLVVWPILSVLLWKILVSDAAPALIKYLSFAYAFMVCLMALSSVWLYNATGKNGLIPALGCVIFLSSDSIFGYFLMDGNNAPLWSSMAIWLTYFTAQLFIAHVPFVWERTLVGEANK